MGSEGKKNHYLANTYTIRTSRGGNGTINLFVSTSTMAEGNKRRHEIVR